MYVNEKGYVYVVVEHHNPDVPGHSAIVHGVYSTKFIAEMKRLKLSLDALWSDKPRGYIAVLKKTIEGPSIKVKAVIIESEK